jgi:hypothetical protein
MSRTLVSTLVFVGCMGAACAQPPPDVDEVLARRQRIARRLDEQAAALQPRRPVQAALAVRDLIGDKWISEARQELEWQLTVHIEDIDRACSLTDAQRKKLQLAGRGDIKRFCDGYEQVKRKSQVAEHREENLQDLQQEANYLLISLSTGLFLEHSLLVKSLRSTLTDEQFARYEAKALKGRALRHGESVLNAAAMLKLGFELAAARLGRNTVLREEQRQDLITLIMHETKPSRRPGRYDPQVLILQLGRLPEEKLKRLFDDDQWEIMKREMARYQQLKQDGLLPVEGDGE